MLMNYDISTATPEQATELANIRLAAMKDSLQAIGRYDPIRARERFLSRFEPANTKCMHCGVRLIGFYVLNREKDHLYLDHLYIHPDYQGDGAGTHVIQIIKDISLYSELPVRLGALKQSEANNFYLQHGFVFTHSEEWDNYYEFTP